MIRKGQGYQPIAGDGPTSSPPNEGSSGRPSPAGRHIGAGDQVKRADDVFEEIALALGPTIGKRLREAIADEVSRQVSAALELERALR